MTAAAANEKPDAIAARIAAVEQRLLVAVLQRDDHARLMARAEITRLKDQLKLATRYTPRGSTRTAAAERRVAAT